MEIRRVKLDTTFADESVFYKVQIRMLVAILRCFKGRHSYHFQTESIASSIIDYVAKSAITDART